MRQAWLESQGGDTNNMALSRHYLLCLLSWCILLAAPLSTAVAQLSVDRSYVYFRKGERPILNVVVSNLGKSPLQVESVTEEVVRAGFDDEHRDPTEELVASPRRFVLQGGDQRTVRLLLKRALDDREHTYRLKFVPSEAPGGEGGEMKPKGTQIKVLTGIGMLIFAHPLDEKPKISVKHGGNFVEITNDGNMNAFLDEGRACSGLQSGETEGNGCRSLGESESRRLYPGNTWRVKLPNPGLTAVYRKQVGGGATDTLIISP